MDVFSSGYYPPSPRQTQRLSAPTPGTARPMLSLRRSLTLGFLKIRLSEPRLPKPSPHFHYPKRKSPPAGRGD